MANAAPSKTLLPPGATKWATVNDVAIRTGKEVRTVRNACEQGLFHSLGLAGGYLGIWVAALDDDWPVDGPRVEAYRAHRRARAMVGQPLASAAGVAARRGRAARAAKKARRRP